VEVRTDHAPRSRASLGSWLARPVPATALLVLAVGLVLAGQELLRPPPRLGAALGAFVLGLVLVVGLERLAPQLPAPAADARPALSAAGRRLLAQRALLGAVFGGAAAIWALMRARQVADNYTDVVLVWVGTLVAAILASAWGTWPPPGQWVRRLRGALARERAAVGLAALLFVAALIVRAAALDGFPYVFGGDEGSEAMWAVSVLDGRWTDPFATGWYNLPTLWFFLQAASMRLFGESVAGVRMVTAVIGAVTVLFTYLLARRLYGPAVGLSAAVLLAAFHYHVFFSRVASLQVVDTLAIVAALYWLDRGFEGARPTACLLAGYAVGFAQYGSFAGRLLPLVAVAYVVVTLARTAVPRGIRAVTRAVWARQPRQVGWVVLGAAVAVLPLCIHYVEHPNEFNRRVNEVSIFASGWLANEQRELAHRHAGRPRHSQRLSRRRRVLLRSAPHVGAGVRIAGLHRPRGAGRRRGAALGQPRPGPDRAAPQALRLPAPPAGRAGADSGVVPRWRGAGVSRSNGIAAILCVRGALMVHNR
jgi:hypothetical protein